MIEGCVAILRAQGVELSPGLTPGELADVERRFGFEFGADHRDLLLAAVPVDRGWVDWRRDPEAEIRHRLAGPMDGILFDVSHDAFWAASWGPRPSSERDALEQARREVESWPTLIPIFGHRYVPAAPIRPGAPVFSVMQSDVIYYGADLFEYVRREFGGALRDEVGVVTVEVPPWSLLADGYRDAEL